MHAARRLARMGLAPRRFGWGDGSLTALEVARVLREADGGGSDDVEVASLARAYWERFQSEFPATAQVLAGDRGRRFAEGYANVGFATGDGRVLPGRARGTDKEDVSDPFPLSELSEVRGGGRLSVLAPSLVGATAELQRQGESWKLTDGHVLLSWKGVGAWAGRRAPAFLTGAGGGLLFNGDANFDAVGLALTRPLMLPSVLRLIGPVRFETFVSRLDSNAAVRHPWLLGSRVSVSPHPRLLLGGTMGAMFGGDSVAPVTLRTLWSMFTAHGIGAAGTEFENGLASVDVRFRPPLGPLPMMLYLEWAAEDNHAAWVEFPATVAGVELTAVPGAPAVSLGIERTSFSTPCDSCKFYAMWYRHYLFLDGWTQDRVPIGHSLGGEGVEWLLYATWDAPERGIRIIGRTFTRDRGTHNIYSQTRNGRSVGGALSAAFRTGEQLELTLRGAGEWGRGDWRETSLAAQLRWLF